MLDTPPEPKGGYKSILNNIKYPEDAIKDNIKDTIIVKVLVNYKGEVCRTKILHRGNLDSFNKAARDALLKTKWKPAIYINKPVNFWISVPVRFNLD